MHLRAEGRARRPTNAAALTTSVAAARAAATGLWEQGAPIGSKAISYCIPVLGRIDDLKGTLARNLRENEARRDQVEFLIVEFGADPEARLWLEQEFPEALESGYLRLVEDVESLDTWHFGKARMPFDRICMARFIPVSMATIS